jgi:tetratricopeptide (TPR) repeat protein
VRCALAPLLVLLALLALPCRPAHADPQVDLLIEQARREKAALRYQEALAVLDSALVLGRSTPADLIIIYRLAGELAAGLDDHDQAVAHFRRLLALAPDTVLPEGTSPKVTSPFAVALAATREYGPLRSDNDPVRMVAATRDGTFFDRHGNVLLVLQRAPAPAPAPARSPSPLFLRPLPYALAAVAFAAGTTYFALDARSAQGDLDAIAANERPGTTYAETLDIRARGRRSALLANIGIGATAATAALAAYLYVRERRSSSVTIEPTPTSVAVALSLSF